MTRYWCTVGAREDLANSDYITTDKILMVHPWETETAIREAREQGIAEERERIVRRMEMLCTEWDDSESDSWEIYRECSDRLHAIIADHPPYPPHMEGDDKSRRATEPRCTCNWNTDLLGHNPDCPMIKDAHDGIVYYAKLKEMR